jgi:alkylated DNA repair dioxygenase AlkB
MIPGLSYFPNALTEEQEQALLQELDGPDAEWHPLTDSPQSRRVQHYGYRYDYKRRTVSEPTTPIPAHWADLFPSTSEWNQVIVNEYLPGQGISAHTDSLAYADVIQCYTLGSGATMRFTPEDKEEKGERRDIYVEPRSLYIMAGEARYQWKHEMVSRKTDTVQGVKKARSRRISVTLRFVLPA